MATTFKKLGEVDVIETFADTSTVLVEEDGDVKRIALTALLEDVLFAAFVEEGVIQPVYDDDTAVFTDGDGKVLVYDVDKQNGDTTASYRSNE